MSHPWLREDEWKRTGSDASFRRKHCVPHTSPRCLHVVLMPRMMGRGQKPMLRARQMKRYQVQVALNNVFWV